ncbi:cilia- and flagella-associated protein 97-like [Anguilla rostrata]|uniref:Uncharacterized protein n=1 Tax=Anguilla anguilla TaxID=7936 RepID=A0A9D3S3B3_ANGAN|nr:cilia- and flagella-associated protein 97-like [Anguilla anguilla]KAG5853153.1 hypothetical protein ANANG_G00070050 [Anguilla anguilla]
MPKVKEQRGGKDQFFECNDGSDRNQDKTKEKDQEQEGKDQRMSSRPQPYNTCTRLYHTAQNRKDDMERIDRENRVQTRRLDTTKPSRGMGRMEQLADYDRQASYRGLPAPGPSNLTETPSEAHFKLMVKSHYSRVKLTGFLQ